MTTLTVSTPDDSTLRSQVEPLIQAAHALRIESPEQHAAALGAFKNLRLAEKQFDDLFEPARAALEAGKKAFLRLKDEAKRPVVEAKAIVEKEINRWEADQRAKALEQQRLLEQQERLRQQEARLQAEEAARQAKSAEEAAAAKADAEKAKLELAAPVAVSVAPAIAKVEGVGQRVTHEAVVDDLGALIRHAAQHPEFESCLMPAMPQLNFLARRDKTSLKIPGVRVLEKTVRMVRS